MSQRLSVSLVKESLSTESIAEPVAEPMADDGANLYVEEEGEW